MSFVSAAIVTDPDQLLDTAVDSINGNLTANGYPGWTAQDATLAVLILSAVSQMIADGALVSATVVPAIFRAFGTQLLGIPYGNGAQASVLSTWTFTSASPAGGYTITGGTTVVVDGYAFYTSASYTSNEGDTTASILLVASAAGSLYNGLGGVNQTVFPNDQIDWVASIVLAGVASGGADQQTDPDYQNGLVSTLALQAPRPLVYSDYASFVQSDIALNATGVAVGRATSIDGYYPNGRVLSTGGAGSTALSCALTNSSATVIVNSPSGTQVPSIGATVTGTGVSGGTTVAASPAPTYNTFTLSAPATTTNTESLTFSALSGWGPAPLTCTATLTSSSTSATINTAPYPGAVPDVGASVIGAGIPAGATVASSPVPTTSSFSLSAAATSNESAETVTITSWTSVQLCNTAFVTDDDGNALAAASMDSLATWLQTYRPQNWDTFVVAPTYTPIYVDVTIHCLPTAVASSVATSVQSALLAYLNPASWGNTLQTTGEQWLNSVQGYSTVRFNSLIGVAEAVAGVQYVTSGGLTLGTSPSPSGTSDLVLSGPVPLPTSTAATITVTTA